MLMYNIISGLEIKTNIGYNSISSEEIELTPIISQRPENWSFNPRFATYGDKNFHTWNIEPQISYQRSVNNGKFDFLIGSTFQQSVNNYNIIAGSGYSSDLVLKDLRSAVSIFSIASSSVIYKYNALFSRFNYLYQSKYIINLTARRDGSSRYGIKNRYGNFGAVGLRERRVTPTTLMNFISSKRPLCAPLLSARMAA